MVVRHVRIAYAGLVVKNVYVLEEAVGLYATVKKTGNTFEVNISVDLNTNGKELNYSI